MRALLVSAALSVVASVTTWLSQPAVVQRGLAKGAVAPPIDMVDQFGRHQTLQTLAGDKGLVILFVRSADW